MTRLLNERLIVFINNDGGFKRFFGIELTIQKAKHFLSNPKTPLSLQEDSAFVSGYMQI